MKTRTRRLKELLVEAVLNNAVLKDLSAKPLTPAAGRSLTPATTHEDHPFTGSMRFVYLHVVLFGAWLLVNLEVVPGVPRFDPSFVVLAMVASVEAIFLSTFVLISQNRMAGQAGRPRPAHQPPYPQS